MIHFQIHANEQISMRSEGEEAHRSMEIYGSNKWTRF